GAGVLQQINPGVQDANARRAVFEVLLGGTKAIRNDGAVEAGLEHNRRSKELEAVAADDLAGTGCGEGCGSQDRLRVAVIQPHGERGAVGDARGTVVKDAELCDLDRIGDVEVHAQRARRVGLGAYNLRARVVEAVAKGQGARFAKQ